MKLTKEQVLEMRRAVVEMGDYGAYTPRVVLILIDTILEQHAAIENFQARVEDAEARVLQLMAEFESRGGAPWEN